MTLFLRRGQRDDIALELSAEHVSTDQHRVVRFESNGRPLLVWGGPGTGKTIVGLRRLSAQLYASATSVVDPFALVVGPNPTFITYVRQVLPRIGLQAEYVSIDELGPLNSPPSRVDSPLASSVKGREDMAGVIDRWLRSEVKSLQDAKHIFNLPRGSFTLSAEEVGSVLDANSASGRPFYERKKRFLNDLANLARDGMASAYARGLLKQHCWRR